jgi:hypothetical protein
VYVVAGGCVAASVVLLPAFAGESLLVALPLLGLGGILLTLPLAPADALMADVVVAQLRGRAAAVRSIVRSVAGLSPVVIGALSDQLGLRTAIMSMIPAYAAGGLVMLVAARYYLTDLSFVLAEARRLHASSDVSRRRS